MRNAKPMFSKREPHDLRMDRTLSLGWKVAICAALIAASWIATYLALLLIF
jgi:NADH:ubiquinone oxidoreductase subunit H